MIYVHLGQNDYHQNLADLLRLAPLVCEKMRALQLQTIFLLDGYADDILRECSGLEDFTYFFSTAKGLYSQLQDLGPDLEADSIVIENLDFHMADLIYFEDASRNYVTKKDLLAFAREKPLGMFYLTEKAKYRMHKLSHGRILKASDFEWDYLIPVSEQTASVKCW